MSTTQTDLLRHLRTLAARQSAGVLSDQQLLERFLSERSEASFAALVQRHGPMVLSVCRRVLHHVQDAEDAFQAAFLVLARKAGSIRKQESVGSWLHGVAYHVAQRLKAKTLRRAAHERCVTAQPPGDALEDITWRELRSILDEELQRLPEMYRAPLVLCYLEARTQDEAARRLGWSKNTFGRRLARARDLLARRLTRRGLTLTAALTAPLLVESTAEALVPPLLAATTVRAGLALATGNTASGLVPAHIAALADGGVKTLLANKVKWALALFLALSVAAGGVLTHQTLGTKSAAMQPAAQPPATPAKPVLPRPAVPAAAKDKAIEVKGRVLDPDGKPFAGAAVYLVPRTARKKADLTVHATTDKDGRFCLTAPQTDVESGARLLATARGHGPDWMDLKKDRETMLRLVKDDVPIRGRVLDLEGQPVAGVMVEISLLAKRAEEGDLTPWIKARQMEGGGQPPVEVPMKYLWAALLDVPNTVKTGADGRFRLTGFGRERVLHLNLRGPTIENSFAFVITRPGPKGGWPTRFYHLYGATFDYPVGPSKPVIGTVRDKATGKPLAGVHVQCYSGGSIGGFNGSGYAVTDEKGRYRLTGVGKAREYAIAAEKLSYFNVTKMQIGDTPGLEPLTVDFELTKGILVRGRLTDKDSGKPVRGRVTYLARAENPHLKDYPDLGNVLQFHTIDQGAIGPDGSFSVPAIPGPAFLCFRADDLDRYIGFELKGWDGFRLRAVPGGLHPSQFHAVVPIEVSEKDPKSTTIDIALEPGRTRTGTIVGPDGEPLSGVCVVGRIPVYPAPAIHSYSDRAGPPRLKDASFTIFGLNPRKERTLVFFHPEKKLGKVQRIRGDEKGPLTVRLEPLGAITGRVVDTKGRPWAGLTANVSLTRLITAYKDLPWELLSGMDRLLEIKQKTDGDGCFRVEGLLPGLQYNLVFSEGEIKPGVQIVYYQESLTAEHGKTKDLGDLKSKLVPEKAAKEKP